MQTVAMKPKYSSLAYLVVLPSISLLAAVLVIVQDQSIYLLV